MSSKLLFSLLLLLVFLKCFPQNSYNSFLETKRTPSSPSATSLNKFGDYSVNMFHGLPQIDIPIFNLKVGEIEIPISLKYHASGIKVNDEGSSVGIGWTLGGGGHVSRIINYRPDETNSFPTRDLNSETIHPESNIDDYHFLQAYSQANALDYGVDYFSYFLPGGNSGKFVFNFRDNNKPILIPKAPLKIVFLNESGKKFFRILDNTGIEYVFSDLEVTSSNIPNTFPNETYQISYIVSVDKKDTVNFIYAQRWGVLGYGQVDMVSVVDNIFNSAMSINCFDPINPFITIHNTESPQYSGTEKFLTEISFPNGKIDFVYNDRLDGYWGQKALKSIKIYNKTVSGWNLIKESELFHSYFTNPLDSNVKRLKLDSVGFRSTSGFIQNSYKLSYNTHVDLPKKASKAIDHWGYFNNVPNLTLLPSIQIQYEASPNGVIGIGSSLPNAREVNPNYSNAYMLNRIYYPTGGYTTFEFENNKYLDNGSEKYAGGHRIKSISNFTSNNELTEKLSYRYGLNESGFGRPNFDLEIFSTPEKIERITYVSEGLYSNLLSILPIRTFSSAPTIPVTPFDGSPITYDCVSEYKEDPNMDYGKSVFYFSDTPDEYLQSTTYPSKFFVKSNHLDRGQLISSKFYKYKDGNFKMIKEVNNIYSKVLSEQYSDLTLLVKKIKIFDKYIRLPASGGGDIDCNFEFINNFHPDFNYFIYNDKASYHFHNEIISTSDQLLTKEVIKTYVDGLIVEEEKNLSYSEDDKMLLKSVGYKTSKGEDIKFEYTYPSDYDGNPVYDEMVNRMMINYRVDEKNINVSSNKVVEAKKINYSFFNGNEIIKPSTLLSADKNQVYRSDQSFSKYNENGKVAEILNSDGVSVVYLWGYNSQYVVAEIINAKWDDVQGLVDQDFLNNVYGGSDDVTLRNHLSVLKNLSGAQVKIFTYLPLIGVTSIYDNNSITYYEYDSFNRLSSILDKDKNIVKRICYSFEGKQIDCNVFGNQITSQIFQKDDCQSGLTGSHVLYSIPAGTYSAFSQTEANQLALNDIAANGQAYANANGTCSQQFFSAAISDYFANGSCGAPEPYYVTIPYGQFTSSISQADADNKAYLEAQRLADQYGVCLNITPLYGSNSSTYQDYIIQLSDVNSNAVYYFYLDPSTTDFYMGEIPWGYYNVSITPIYEVHSYSTTFGCDYIYNNRSGTINVFTPVPINDVCNLFLFY